MLKYRRTAVAVFVFMFLAMPFFDSFAQASGTDEPSAWAAGVIEHARQNGMIDERLLDNIPFRDKITRKNFFYLAMSLYESLAGEVSVVSDKSYFTDTDDPYILAAYELGLAAGRGDGTFAPDDPVTYQEAVVAITRTLAAGGVDTSMTAQQILDELKRFTDLDDVAGWAAQAFAFALKNGLICGISQTELCPAYHITGEQAVVIIYRCIQKYAVAMVPTAEPEPSVRPGLSVFVSGAASLVDIEDRAAVIEWEPVSGASMYRVDMYLDKDNFWFEDKDVFVRAVYAQKTCAQLKNLRAGMVYRVAINALDESGAIIDVRHATIDIEPPCTQQQKYELIFSEGDITEKEQADALMQSVTVDVWKIGSDGKKYPSKATIVVHKRIADIVKAVFDEIFSGEEQFPIKDVSGYSWREPMESGRLSHHNYGTAIDINWQENYCIYSDQTTTIGKFWLPGLNPYSIPPDGEVVSIFAKYGFVWGGDMWSNPKDYMHFSYLGM